MTATNEYFEAKFALVNVQIRDLSKEPTVSDLDDLQLELETDLEVDMTNFDKWLERMLEE